jgi:uncharacterized protein YcnI
MTSSRIRRLLAGSAVCAAVVVAFPSTAWAHVNAAGEVQPDGTTKVTFSFTHGCEEAPTTTLRVQLPAGTTDVTPQNPAGWTSQVDETVLAWTGGSIPNGAPGTFVVTMRLTGNAGDTVFFPTIQACPGDLEDTWIDKTEDPGATSAAPRIRLAVTNTAPATTAAPTTAKPEGAAVTTSTTAPPPSTASVALTDTAAKATTEPTSSGATTPLLIGANVILLLLIGIVGFALSRRRSSSQ